MGTDVYVDGERAGAMEEFAGGAHFTTWLKNGTHEVKVHRNGYVTATEAITVPRGDSEHYLRVDLRREPAPSR